MGEVYKGRDTRLDRLVALKLLAPHLTHHPESRDRFEREATTIANLKHAHICVLYDIGKQVLPVEAEEVSQSPDREGGGTSPRAANQSRDREGAVVSRGGSVPVDFLVLEYLEGETLSQRLARGPLPLAEAMQYAVEVADALDKAHRAGVTHRDIKPGNIMLVPSTSPGAGGTGRASGSGPKTETKLLDFGLAKLKQEVAKATIPASERPTIPGGALTQDGTILGTLHYMAPEQLESKEVDGRADIFSFGAVVHEMVTGKKAFPGETQASIIAKILDHDPPPVSSLEPPGKLSPPALDRVVERCLAKDREDRWQAMRDVCHELQWIKDGGSSAGVAMVAEPKPLQKVWRRVALVGLAALLIGAILTGLTVWNLRPAPVPQPVSRLEVSLPPDSRLAGLGSPAVTLSLDGSQLVYVGATAGGRPQLFLRALDSLETKPIPGTEGAFSPFFSPDGQWIGFFADNALKKVSISGGAAVTLCRLPAVQAAASWGANDTIVFHNILGSSLLQVPAVGGTPQPFTTLQGELFHAWPEFLPGGKAVLFTVFTTGTGDGQIVAQGFPTGERKVLVQGGTNPHYVSSGHLVFAQAGTVMAAPFDLARLEVTGPPVPILEGVMGPQFSVSNLGSLVYVSGSFGGNQGTLVWVDRKGAAQPLPAPQREYGPPRLSADGRRIATVIQRNVWVYDISRDTLTRLTFEPNGSLISAWTPDGKRITFQINKGGSSGLFWTPADGSGPEERIATSEHFLVPGSWSPDGKLFAFTEVDSATSDDLWVLSVDGDPRQAGTEGRKAQPFLQTPFREGMPKFSPDGRWLAYRSDESGRPEVYVQPYPGPGGKWQISTEGGGEPVWARNGELFYRSGNKMMAVETTTQPTFSPGKPRLLFEEQYVIGPGGGAAYDVTPDGQRFLMLKAAEQEQAPTQINVVLNWFEELKRRVPSGR
jgi:serine/threonine protein kinase/Tol biopolymer transport system component